MRKTLRKGYSSVYLQHAITGHSIGAKEFDCEISDGQFFLRLVLAPVDSNQSSDLELLGVEPLISAQVDDTHVIDRIRKALRGLGPLSPIWELELQYQESTFVVLVRPFLGDGSLQLMVQPSETDSEDEKSSK